MKQSTGDAIAEVFRRAAEVITTNGLYQGTYCDPIAAPDPAAPFAGGCMVCTIGAFRVAVGLAPVPADESAPAAEEPLIWEAIAFLSPRVESSIVDEDPVERVACWNDADGRTADEVASALLLAAEAVAA
jgi:hypothetical protein